jgi:uncharacterized protein YaiE (UPF0345 family)
MADPTEDAASDPWFRTTSPERAIHLCSTAFYPHRLTLLGRSNGFGLTQRVTQVGPIAVGDITYQSHDDAEDFFIISGTQQVLTQGAHGLEWRDAQAGDYVQVAGGMLHAHRNISVHPAIELVITTARLGRFFREIARPITSPQPPTPDEFDRFVAVAAQYGYILGTPEENAAVGIDTPNLTANGW